MRKIVGLLIVVGMLALTACSPEIEVSNYDFPINKSDIDIVLVEQGLPWTAKEEANLKEGSKSHFISDADGKYRLSIASTKTENLKMMYIALLKKPIYKSGEVNSLMKDVELNDQIKVVGLATKMYGSNIDYNKLYKDAVKTMDARDMNYNGYYFKKYDEIYVTLAFSYDEMNKGYTLNQIEMLNETAYEANIESKAINLEQYGLKNIASKEIISVAEVKTFGDEVYKCKVKGKIKNIDKLKVKDANKIKDIGFQEEIKDIEIMDYSKAILFDGIEEIDVLIEKSLLSKDDLAKERTHYIYYNEANQIPIVKYSVIGT